MDAYGHGALCWPDQIVALAKAAYPFELMPVSKELPDKAQL